MVYRDDRDALLARADALERERDQAKQEADELRAENERLRAAEPEPPPAPVAIEKRRTRSVRKRRARRRASPSWGAAGATLILSTAAMVAVGAPIAFMVTVPFAVAAATAALTWRSGTPVPTGKGVPFDQTSYRVLLDGWKGGRIVRLEVRFKTHPLAAQRESIKQAAIRGGTRADWEEDVLVLASKKLRGREEVRAFCTSALEWLEAGTGELAIARVTARPGGQRLAKPRRR